MENLRTASRRHSWGARSCAIVGLSLGLTCCVILPRPVVLPEDDEPVVLILSAALRGPLAEVARHPWIAVNARDGEGWSRWEVMCCPPNTVRNTSINPLSDHGGGGGDVQIHGVIRGNDAEEAMACIEKEARAYPYNNQYRMWPGPNSNTFVDYIVGACGLGTDLPATSIGRDYRGAVSVSTTAGGTGVQFETPVVGLKLGLTEGIEVHLFTLAFGVDFWPPAIIVPVGVGRIGFADR